MKKAKVLTIDVDDKKYDIYMCRSDDNLISFKTKIDEQVLELSCSYTSELAHDLKSIYGLDVDEELDRILTEEFKLEISKLTNGEYWKNVNKEKT